MSSTRARATWQTTRTLRARVWRRLPLLLRGGPDAVNSRRSAIGGRRSRWVRSAEGRPAALYTTAKERQSRVMGLPRYLIVLGLSALLVLLVRDRVGKRAGAISGPDGSAGLSHSRPVPRPR